MSVYTKACDSKSFKDRNRDKLRKVVFSIKPSNFSLHQGAQTLNRSTIGLLLIVSGKSVTSAITKYLLIPNRQKRLKKMSQLKFRETPNI